MRSAKEALRFANTWIYLPAGASPTCLQMDSPEERQNQSPTSQLIRNITAAIQAPHGLKPPLLKSLYYLLVHSSLNPSVCYSRPGSDSTSWQMEIGLYQSRVSFEVLRSLSDVLCKELSNMFKQFISALPNVSASRNPGQACLHLDMLATTERLNLLLRCSMVMLDLLVPDHHCLLENGRLLLEILRELYSLNLKRGNVENSIPFGKVSRECAYNDNDYTTAFTEDIVASLQFMETFDLCLPFLCSMLEVFADELLLRGQLRSLFNKIHSHSSTSRKLFLCSSSHGGIGLVIEVISAHFCLLFSDEQAFENFLDRLFWLDAKDFRAPELSLTAALVLLLDPLVLSAPKLLQAHLISSVSEAITIGMCLNNMTPDIRLLDCYLAAFERSVTLYVKHMCTSQMNNQPTAEVDTFLEVSTKRGYSQPSFDSFVPPLTRKKINLVIIKLDNLWQSQLRDMLLRTKSDLAASSVAFINKNKVIIDLSFSDSITSILSSIIVEALSDEVDETALHASLDTNPEDMYLLASILKLMSCSLLQAIRCLTHYAKLGSLRTLKDFSSCKEYDHIVGIITCFRQFSIRLPIQKSLCARMETHCAKHKESKLMLLHFSGLLSLCFSTGLDFLAKGCISTMMSLMNLFVFEEGNVDILRFNDRSESFSSGFTPDNVQEAAVDRKSSLIVASKFQKIQTLYLSMPSLASDCIASNDGQAKRAKSSSILEEFIEEETEETCNGKLFLKCRLVKPGEASDFDDLADFVECKRGKDYTGWLKDRQRYRKWKGEKMAVLRWRKMKRTWKLMKGNSTKG